MPAMYPYTNQKWGIKNVPLNRKRFKDQNTSATQQTNVIYRIENLRKPKEFYLSPLKMKYSEIATPTKLSIAVYIGIVLF